MQKLKERYKGSILLKFAVLCFAGFILVSLVSQQLQISEKREELQNLQDQLNTQTIRNEEIENSLENSGGLEEYAERRPAVNWTMPTPENGCSLMWAAAAEPLLIILLSGAAEEEFSVYAA